MCDNMIDEKIKKARVALEQFEEYSQGQVDKVVKTIALCIYDNAAELGAETSRETGFGTPETQKETHEAAAITTWHYLKDKKSVGIIEKDPENGLVLFAKPVGVVACVTPSTNVTSTIGNNAMIALKGRNVIIIAPHPSAKDVSVKGVRLLNEALKKIGAPDNLIQIIEEPNLSLTKELMSKADVVMATGGPGMIKSAYSSGKPSFGVGPGNVQVLVAEDYCEYQYAAETIVNSRATDNGIECICEQSVFIPRDKADTYVKEFVKAGAHWIEDQKMVEKLASALFDEEGHMNRECVGKSAIDIAEKIGLNVSAGCKVLLVEGGEGKRQLFRKEKLCPVMQFCRYDSFDAAVQQAKQNLLLEGAGHSAIVYTNNEKIAEFVSEKLPVSRVIVNQPGDGASGGTMVNGLPPTFSLGCGSWGNNSLSENLTYKHLLNITRLAYIIEGKTYPTPEEAWAE